MGIVTFRLSMLVNSSPSAPSVALATFGIMSVSIQLMKIPMLFNKSFMVVTSLPSEVPAIVVISGLIAVGFVLRVGWEVYELLSSVLGLFYRLYHNRKTRQR